MSENPPLNIKIILTALLVSICAGLFGGLVGAICGTLVAEPLGISSMEGGQGYFAVFLGCLTSLVGFVFGNIFWLRRQGIRGGGLFLGALTSIGCVLMLVATAGALYTSQQVKIVNPNGLPPKLSFEVLAPPTSSIFSNLTDVRVSLNTDQNQMDAELAQTADPRLLSGAVDLYFQTTMRLLALQLPDKEVRIFNLTIPADPRSQALLEWSDWKRADLKDRTDTRSISSVTENPDYLIRVKMEPWQ